jgi:hypothetical protein
MIRDRKGDIMKIVYSLMVTSLFLMGLEAFADKVDQHANQSVLAKSPKSLNVAEAYPNKGETTHPNGRSGQPKGHKGRSEHLA